MSFVLEPMFLLLGSKVDDARPKVYGARTRFVVLGVKVCSACNMVCDAREQGMQDTDKKACSDNNILCLGSMAHDQF